MSEEKILSIEEIIATKTGQSLPLKRNLYLLTTGDVIDLVKEVSKLHVKAALKAASERASICYGSSMSHIDQQSILTAYPPENIK